MVLAIPELTHVLWAVGGGEGPLAMVLVIPELADVLLAIGEV